MMGRPTAPGVGEAGPRRFAPANGPSGRGETRQFGIAGDDTAEIISFRPEAAGRVPRPGVMKSCG